MKTKLIYLLLLFALSSFSQEIPIIKVGKKTISIKKLKVNVSVVGDIAITTYDMEFYNPKNRILEGELSFPLGENQSVTRFALDINGNLREAVVIEKEKARVAFESTVRNRIDPALLEQTKGNNYKARIYPIPARGYKRVVVAFQQKLVLNNEFYYYKLPFNFKNKLEEFSL
ncbi:VIT domain-containing protein, partial [Tenacibaculum ovolyticum]|uniref:VIT domain-containing protein n=1 Tax=Tenacibaculum ovolyticum TaxID=104270 RepID=UPI000A9D26B8